MAIVRERRSFMVVDNLCCEIISCVLSMLVVHCATSIRSDGKKFNGNENAKIR